jgi:[ribosomal protein S5]-alanine N-acetyltransferase
MRRCLRLNSRKRKIINVSLRLRTERLELVAATLPLVEAEITGPSRLAELLQAEVEAWPPPLNDENSLRWTFEKLQTNPERAGFFAWYVVLLESEKRRDGKRLLVGMVGITGPPDQSGVIEVGYSVLEKYQKRGIGTEATRELIKWAFEHPAVQMITAQTFPDLIRSIKVMKSCGMSLLGTGSEPGAIRYGITREQFQRQ